MRWYSRRIRWSWSWEQQLLHKVDTWFWAYQISITSSSMKAWMGDLNIRRLVMSWLDLQSKASYGTRCQHSLSAISVAQTAMRTLVNTINPYLGSQPCACSSQPQLAHFRLPVNNFIYICPHFSSLSRTGITPVSILFFASNIERKGQWWKGEKQGW